MGTNFYLMSKNKESVKKNFGEYPDMDNYSIVDEPYLGYEIHLCKRSCGWRPLFQLHDKFKTFKELERFFINNSADYKIFDEYGKEYTFTDFKQEMIDHSNVDPKPLKWVYEHNPLFNEPGKKSLDTIECSPEEAELYIPINHKEYAKTELEAIKKFNVHNYSSVSEDRYINDPDYKFDWVEGDFG